MALAAIWSNSQDPTSRLLRTALEGEGHEVLEVITGPERSDQIGVILSDEGIHELLIAGQSVRDLDTVFYRKPVPPSFNYEDSQERFLAREIMQGLESVLSLTGARWVNHPVANRAAADKMGNLVRAQRLGLHIPKTWVGASTPKLITGKLVGKPVTHGLMNRPDGAAMVFATRIPEGFNPAIDLEPGVPMLVQEEVQAEVDVRATVVGERVLVAERPRAEGELDWRSGPDSEGWASADMPADVQLKLRRLVAERGLTFGACDLLRIGNQYVFLELNPNGQWGWLELEAGLPISAAMALLVGGQS